MQLQDREANHIVELAELHEAQHYAKHQFEDLNCQLVDKIAEQDATIAKQAQSLAERDSSFNEHAQRYVDQIQELQTIFHMQLQDCEANHIVELAQFHEALCHGKYQLAEAIRQKTADSDHYEQRQSAMLEEITHLWSTIELQTFSREKAEQELHQYCARQDQANLEHRQLREQMQSQVVALHAENQNLKYKLKLTCEMVKEEYDARAVHISDLRLTVADDANTLLTRLQRESAARRKAESALNRASETADPNSVAKITQMQIEAERQTERLMRELDSTRLLCLSVQQQANTKIRRGQLEIIRLREDLAKHQQKMTA